MSFFSLFYFRGVYETTTAIIHNILNDQQKPILSTATKTQPVSAEECIISISTISCNYYIIIAKFNSERKQSIYSHYEILFTRFIISRSNDITFHIINCRQLLSDV